MVRAVVSTNFTTVRELPIGRRTDTPVPGDYDRDGTTDVAIRRSATGTWHVLLSDTDFTNYASYQLGVRSGHAGAGRLRRGRHDRRRVNLSAGDGHVVCAALGTNFATSAATSGV